MPSLPTCQMWPPQQSKVAKKTIARLVQMVSGTALTLLLFSGLFIGLLGLKALIGIVLVLIAIATAIFLLYEQAYYDRYYYDLAPDVLIIRKGVFSSGETTLPYSRIQDVYIDQDWLDRLFGLYDLHVSSATLQSAANAHIDGLSYAGAETIKNALLNKMLKGRKRR